MEKYQTFLRRLAALLIDSFIMIPLALCDYWFREAQWPITFFYFWLPLSAAVAPVYRILMHGFYGQTLAKMAMEVKVVDAITEESMTMKQAVLRELPQIIFNIAAVCLGLAYFGIEPDPEKVPLPFNIVATLAFIWACLDLAVFVRNPKRRALHDFIAGTVTIRIDAKNQPFSYRD